MFAVNPAIIVLCPVMTPRHQPSVDAASSLQGGDFAIPTGCFWSGLLLSADGSRTEKPGYACVFCFCVIYSTCCLFPGQKLPSSVSVLHSWMSFSSLVLDKEKDACVVSVADPDDEREVRESLEEKKANCA